MPLPELAPLPANAPAARTMYRHYKGHDCAVIGTGYHTETGQHMVAYIEQGSGLLFMRPLSMWHDTVEVDGAQVARFALVTLTSLKG